MSPVDTDLQILDTRRPFTRAAAVRAGISDKVLAGPRYHRLLRGVYVAADVPMTPALRALAALAISDPTAHASHATAARVLGVPVPVVADEHVTVPAAGQRRHVDGVRQHVRPRSRWVLRDGVRVSDPVQLFTELANGLELVDLVVVGDHLVRREGASPEALRASVAVMPGRVGRHARQAASYVRERVDSPMESRLRMLLVLAGVPEPEVNRPIRAEDGRLLRRYDLCWPTVRVIVEYDGRMHVEREQSWERDLTRREAIDADGWRILVVTSRGIYAEPEVTLERVFGLLGTRRLPGLPPRPDPRWRPHFPGRD